MLNNETRGLVAAAYINQYVVNQPPKTKHAQAEVEETERGNAEPLSVVTND
jgi:hypothetical protein